LKVSQIIQGKSTIYTREEVTVRLQDAWPMEASIANLGSWATGRRLNISNTRMPFIFLSLPDAVARAERRRAA
jgi:hypothetical protein